MLQPKASSPPSMKNKACTASTEAITTKAACGPSRMANRSPPPMWPLEPVTGIEKLTIWAAKTKAPSTPIIGTRRSSRAFATRRAQYAIPPALAAQQAPPTAGLIKASAMCMVIGSFRFG